MKFIFKYLLVLTILAPSFVSCYDDSSLLDRLDTLEFRLDSLKDSLGDQVAALNAIVTESTTVSSCEKNADGSYSVTLSDGTSFNVLPSGTDFSSLISYVVIDGKKYWATFDAEGKAVALPDASGKPIPVEVAVDVEIRDGVYYLKINGKEYATGYDAEDVVQVFSSCTPHTDASGQVYALTFTFGEGLEVTVTVDGYKGVLFKMSSIDKTVVSEYYVDFGKSQAFLMDVEDVVDYVMQIPDGWRVSERKDELTGETFVDITAPLAETVEAGAAVAGGDLKVVAVVEGGKAVVSKLHLTTSPFKLYNVTAAKAVIQPTNGILKFVYGISTMDKFDEAGLVAEVNALLSGTDDLPKGYNISESAIEMTHAEVYGEELDEDGDYIFWAFPALYAEEDEDGNSGFYVREDMLRKLMLSPVSAAITVSDVTLFDATVTIDVKGTMSMYAGTVLKSDTILEEIAYQINNEIILPVSDNLKYKGPASAFPDPESAMDLETATTYITWVVPVEEGKKEYTATDVTYKEFTTKSVEAGGTLEVKASDFVVTSSTISSTVSCENAAMIYYAYLSDTVGKRYQTASNDTRMQQILDAENFAMVKGNSAETVVKGAKPESTMWLYAVAIGADGLYGEVLCKPATTETVTFNSIKLTVETVEIWADEAKLKVVAENGTPVDYIYWVGYAKDPFWVGTDTCNGMRDEAELYMAANPDAEAIASVMRQNGTIASDGTLTVTGLKMKTEYIFMVLAKDDKGQYSKGGYKKFTTLEADLGEMVAEGTEKWNEAKNSIVLDWIDELFMLPENSNLSGTYAFKFSAPSDLTAHVVCASDTYFEGAGLTTVTEQIVDIENNASRKYDNGYVPYTDDGEMMTEPDYYKDGELKGGQLMNVYDYYVHGLPSMGFVTYFAKGSHGDGNCIYWVNGADEYYDRALERIEYHKTVDCYLEKAKLFGLTGDEATAWAEALLEAYLPFYKDAKPLIYENDGQPITITQPYAMGLNDENEVMDRVIVVLKDTNGNYYAPMTFEVPNKF